MSLEYKFFNRKLHQINHLIETADVKCVFFIFEYTENVRAYSLEHNRENIKNPNGSKVTEV